MNRLTFILVITLVSGIIAQNNLPEKLLGCQRFVTLEYRHDFREFSEEIFEEVAKDQNSSFVFSQYSVWLALAAIAEGTDEDTQNSLLKILHLPKSSCLREKYYDIATSLESSGEDITLERRRMFILDDHTILNSTWASTVRAMGLVDTKVLPIKNNSEAPEIIRKLIGGNWTDMKLDLTGNSILLDSLFYKALWTTAFENCTQDNVDFFNDKGLKIGKVDLMRVKKRVRLTYIDWLQAKLLELPVGNNGRFRMLFIMNMRKNSIYKTMDNVQKYLRRYLETMPLLVPVSLVPLEVAIPKFNLTSELDLKAALNRMGLATIWSDENASKFISSPPAKPSDFIQRVSISMDCGGVDPTPPSPCPMTNIGTGFAAAMGRGFIANRPFIFGLVDSQTKTWLFSGVYSGPE
ncbi:serpin B5-like [Pectinophora gossypiella]|uniref:serpin B5-like n=1 Tax=Pectinophora gossypiella TaxID=13191 RepID=UPI00214E459D|nr:serpin B5-like [Pectinophora gossypiella]